MGWDGHCCCIIIVLGAPCYIHTQSYMLGSLPVAGPCCIMAPRCIMAMVIYITLRASNLVASRLKD